MSHQTRVIAVLPCGPGLFQAGPHDRTVRFGLPNVPEQKSVVHVHAAVFPFYTSPHLFKLS